MLISGSELFAYAKKRKVAICAFGCVNLEGVESIVSGAEHTKTPVILQMTEGGIKYAGLEELFSVAKTCAEKSDINICIHLDHGRDINLIKRAIDLGFNSVMYDGSHLSIEDNIKNSKEIKSYIGDRDISLEVEIGAIGGKEDDLEAENTLYADIDDVIKMNDEVNPDSIAVAVGTSHGIYKGDINIKYDLIKEAAERTRKPLVLHGTSGVPSQMVKKAIENGIVKVNYDTELKQVFIKEINDYLRNHPNEYDIRKIFSPAIKKQADIVERIINDCKKEE